MLIVLLYFNILKGASIMNDIIWTYFNFKHKNSLKTHQTDVKLLTEYLGKEFEDLNKDDVTKYYQYCMRNVKDGTYKLSTVAKKFAEFSSIAKKIEEHIDDFHLLSYSNPFEEFTYSLNKYIVEKPPSVPNEIWIDRLLTAAQSNIMHYLIISFAYRCALKPSDICRIKVCDFYVYENKDYLLIRAENPYNIELPDDIIRLRDNFLTLNHREPEEFLFLNKRQAPLNAMYISRMLKSLIDEADLFPEYTLYQIREAGGALMLKYGCLPAVVAAQLNISENNARRYTNLPVMVPPVNELVNIRILDPPTK